MGKTDGFVSEGSSFACRESCIQQGKMSVSGTFLVVIAATFLKPLLSSNQSSHLPTVTVYDRYNNISPFEEADPESDGVTNLIFTVRLPQLLTNTKNSDIDMKRQFDPWGGKRHSKSFTKDEEAGRKRQFSPWGGKRSSTKIAQSAGDKDSADVGLQMKDLLSSENKRGFNSWGGKRSFNSWGGKRDMNAKDSKKGFDPWGGKRGFNSWGGKRGFNSWGGKRNFNAWGGKRFVSDLNDNTDAESSIPKKNTNIGGKRQAFNSWGGKRGFNSWGGKRDFNSWGGKRAADLEPEIKELEEDTVPSTYNALIEGTERNMH